MALWDDNLFPIGVPRVSFEYLSVMMITYWFLVGVRGRGLRMSISTNSNGPFARKNCNCLFKIGDVPLCAHMLQLLRVMYTSFAICVQKNSLCIGSCILRWQRWLSITKWWESYIRRSRTAYRTSTWIAQSMEATWTISPSCLSHTRNLL